MSIAAELNSTEARHQAPEQRLMIGENKRRLKKNMSTVSIIEKTGGEKKQNQIIPVFCQNSKWFSFYFLSYC